MLLAAGPVGACRNHPAAPSAFEISTPYEIESLDPHARDLLAQVAICASFYEPLVSRDADLKLQPALALRWFSPSPLTWVFELRPGVRFHDGRPLGAADVVASFERLRRDPKLGLALNVREIASVQALAPLRVEVRTLRPMPLLLNRISLVPILPGGSANPNQPIGTGPYRFAAWQRGSSVRMKRNDDYWGRRPLLGDVTLRLGQAPAMAERELREGRSQVAILGSQAVAARLAQQPSLRVLRRTGLFMKFLGFDLTSERLAESVGGGLNPFRDVRVRQAVSLAIDRERLVERLIEPAVPASQIVPITVFGFNPDLPQLRPDVERARALLQEAGLGAGFRVTLHARRIAGSAAGPVAEMLATIGIQVHVVEQLEAEVGQAGAVSGFYLSRFGCETGDASDMLSAALHGSDASLIGAAAPGADAGPFAQALQAGMESDQPELRGAALMQIMTVAMKRLPIVPLYFDEDVYGLQRGYEWRPRADGYILPAEIRPSSP